MTDPTLSHLVGRKLVPFFMDDGAQNTQHIIPPGGSPPPHAYEPGAVPVIQVRQFSRDGYFEPSTDVPVHTSSSASSCLATVSSYAKQKKKSKSKTPGKAGPPSPKYAGAAFEKAPAHDQVPLPMHLAFYSPNSSPTSNAAPSSWAEAGSQAVAHTSDHSTFQKNPLLRPAAFGRPRPPAARSPASRPRQPELLLLGPTGVRRVPLTAPAGYKTKIP
eukprot:g28716.t1